MKENYIIKMITSKNILNEKFINYFIALDYREDEKILTLFLDTMLALVEQCYLEYDDIKSPAVIIKEIEARFVMKSDWQDLLEDIVNSDDIKKLTELELFTILWWLSCKNNILFEQSYYYTQARNGNIGKVLSVLYIRKLKFKNVFITKIEIKNFRNIKDLCVDIDKKIVLVQAEGVHAAYSIGKTNFLNAISWAFCKIIRYGETDANIDVLNDFKNKRISEFNISVKITLKDENGQVYQLQRIIMYSFKNKGVKCLKMEDGYYISQRLFINKKSYNFSEYVEKTKEMLLPYFIDNIDVYNRDNQKEKIKKHLDLSNNNQVFITSYDNHLAQPVLSNILIEKNKDFQIITINKRGV